MSRQREVGGMTRMDDHGPPAPPPRAGSSTVHGAVRSRGPGPGRGGFTLVEVLISVVILSLGLLALMAFSTYTAREYTRSRKVSMATTLAREAIDSLRSLPYADLDEGDATYTATAGSVQLWVTRVVEKPKTNLKKITVAVVDEQSEEVQRYVTYVFNTEGE